MNRIVHNKRSRYDVYIGRGSKWGNPFSHDPDSRAECIVSCRGEAIAAYARWILTQPQLLRDLKELQGQVLGCWCIPKRCHGEVLIYLQNAYFPDVQVPRPPSNDITVAIDPGLHACGVAVFRGPVLIRAFLVSSGIGHGLRDQPAWDAMGKAVANALAPMNLRIHQVVVENPQTYKGRSFNPGVKADDLTQLRGINTAIIRALRPKHYSKYHPHDWKGSVEKSAMLNRIRSRLAAGELAVIEPVPTGLGHGKGIGDILDAIGIGLHHLGRRLI